MLESADLGPDQTELSLLTIPHISSILTVLYIGLGIGTECLQGIGQNNPVANSIETSTFKQSLHFPSPQSFFDFMQSVIGPLLQQLQPIKSVVWWN